MTMDSATIINTLKPALVGHALKDAVLDSGRVTLTRDDGAFITVSASDKAEISGCMSSPDVIDDVMLISAPRIRVIIGETAYDEDRMPAVHTVQAIASGMTLPLVTITTIDGELFDVAVSE